MLAVVVVVIIIVITVDQPCLPPPYEHPLPACPQLAVRPSVYPGTVADELGQCESLSGFKRGLLRSVQGMGVAGVESGREERFRAIAAWDTDGLMCTPVPTPASLGPRAETAPVPGFL